QRAAPRRSRRQDVRDAYDRSARPSHLLSWVPLIPRRVRRQLLRIEQSIVDRHVDANVRVDFAQARLAVAKARDFLGDPRLPMGNISLKPILVATRAVRRLDGLYKPNEQQPLGVDPELFGGAITGVRADDEDRSILPRRA